MNTTIFTKFLTICLITGFQSLSAYSADFYISPRGNDAHPGTREKPFSSIERAKQAAADVFKADKNENCTVWLRGGKYILSEPVVFEPADLKNQHGNLKFIALPGEKPVISGGVELAGWQNLPDGIWRAKLPENSGDQWNPRELFINGQRAVRARYPNEGYLRVKKAGDDRRTHFFFNEGEFPVPEKMENLELVLLHDWSISRIPVKDIDITENKLTAVDSIGARNPAFFNLDHWEPNPRYYLENAMVFLDADYEWVFDAGEKAIYVKLPETDRPENMEMVVPFSEGLILLAGSEKQPVRNIHFEGISFKHSAWETPETGYCGVQACHIDPRPQEGGWAVVPAAVKGEWAENCTFTHCSFANLGGSGLWLGTGSRNCTVSGSEVLDVSGNGIMIGEGRDREINGESWWKHSPEQVALGNTIENCTVAECGRQFYGAVGIWCGLTAETTLRNNEIFDLPYTGISIGWMWSPVPTPCRDNVIDGNHIHHIMQELSDGGGIYMLGLQPGSKIVNNHIHHVSLNAGRAESNGMFLDEGTTDVVVANNLIYNIAKSPLRFHKATTNLVKDNFLFCRSNVPPIQYNNTNEEDIEKVNNQVFSEDEKDFEKMLKKMIKKWEK